MVEAIAQWHKTVRKLSRSASQLFDWAAESEEDCLKLLEHYQ